ncbi:hypothetical protein N9L75_03665 [Porticoccaceae bacterium]|nr:hypothetical protein [Porticoccaceae bacterium]MDA8682402.1 hypothetical protein [Porticoccaceae bacterium]MDB2664459.1 hypothetical protein [Porticoccaceae bacterium]
MRQFILNDVTHDCVGWLMLRNAWEVYLLSEPDNDGVADAYVLGYENEFGEVSLEEYSGHVVSSLRGQKFDAAADLGEIAPPLGAVWAPFSTSAHSASHSAAI